MSEARLTTESGVTVPVSQLLTLTQASKLCEVPKRDVNKYAKDGEIWTTTIGDVVYTTEESLNCVAKLVDRAKLDAMLDDASPLVLKAIINVLKKYEELRDE